MLEDKNIFTELGIKRPCVFLTILEYIGEGYSSIGCWVGSLVDLFLKGVVSDTYALLRNDEVNLKVVFLKYDGLKSQQHME